MTEGWRPRRWAVLLALGCLAVLATPAFAGGLILDARPAGDAGPQLDAAVISPLPLARAEAAAGESTYVVQPGDTLGGIATRFVADAALLAARNNLASPDRIVAGQVLTVRAPSITSAILPDDGALVRAQFWPWPAMQGQTVAVWLEAREPVTFSVQFEDQAYPVMTRDRRAWALLPISPLAEPGTKSLTITIGTRLWRLKIPLEAGHFSTDAIPASASAPILSNPDKVKAEIARLNALFGVITPGGWDARSRFQLPLERDFPHTSPFGSRRTYGGGSALSVHEGEDFSAAPGTPVSAPAAGTVVLAEALFVRGNAVILDHGNGVYSGYWHLSEVDVKVGDRVTPGQRIGAVGSTGLSTGAHLHWEMHVAGKAVDPLQWLEP